MEDIKKTDNPGNDFSEYKREILDRLDKLELGVRDLKISIKEINVEIKKLEIIFEGYKVKMAGVVAGSTIAMTVLLNLAFRYLK